MKKKFVDVILDIFRHNKNVRIKDGEGLDVTFKDFKSLEDLINKRLDNRLLNIIIKSEFFYSRSNNIWILDINDMLYEFIQEGIADENTVFILNHFSHNSKDVLYDDFVEIAKEHDFLITYDGMVYEF